MMYDKHNRGGKKQMDFMNRGVRPSQQSTSSLEGNGSQQTQNSSASRAKSGKLNKLRSGSFLNVAYISLLFSVTIVIIGVLITLVLFDNQSKEEQFVDKNKFQAVFLSNGQVYFGHATELNSDFISVKDVYYLRVNQQVQPGQQANQNDVSLVKLGCELHGPQDVMVINRDQVTFWENLKDDGQVTKAIAEYVKANPDGQDCSQQQNTGGSSNSNPTPAPSADNNSTPTNNSSNTNNSGNINQ